MAEGFNQESFDVNRNFDSENNLWWKNNFKKICVVIFALIWLFLFFKAYLAYSESKPLYAAFSFISLALLVSATYKSKSYSYLFFSVFLWLGLWLKLTLHLILNYDYVEPVGRFYTLNAKMDDVLIVSIVGMLGVLSSYFFVSKIKPMVKIESEKNQSIPFYYDFYSRNRLLIFNVMTLFVIVVCALNVIYEIQLTGVVTKTFLIYPLNSVISWFVSMGFVLFFAVLISWDIRFENEVTLKYLMFFILIATITSICILSRGQYVYRVSGLFVFLLLNYSFFSNIRLSKKVIFVFMAAIMFAIVITSVTVLREFYYSEIPFSSAAASSFSSVFTVILGLAADRWLGIEGLMSVVSYPDKSFSLFYDAFVLKPQIGEINIYNHISNSHYLNMDSSKFAFSTTPGVMAFLYYSGCLWVVFIGALVLSFIMCSLECLVCFLSKSALINAVVGSYLAMQFVTFGITPVNFLKALFFIYSFLLFLKFLETRFFHRLMSKNKKMERIEYT